MVAPMEMGKIHHPHFIANPGRLQENSAKLPDPRWLSMQMSDNTQAIQNMQSTLIDQHKMLLEHDDKLTDEMSVLAEMVQNAINENAHVALDQTEYQKRYDDLAARYDGVMAEHYKVAGQIATLISTKTAALQFIGT